MNVDNDSEYESGGSLNHLAPGWGAASAGREFVDLPDVDAFISEAAGVAKWNALKFADKTTKPVPKELEEAVEELKSQDDTASSDCALPSTRTWPILGSSPGLTTCAAEPTAKIVRTARPRS